jgi:hypothetical protein
MQEMAATVHAMAEFVVKRAGLTGLVNLVGCRGRRRILRQLESIPFGDPFPIQV